MSNSVPPHRLQPTRLHHPWHSASKNTGVGCHFLLQCMKVKSESEVTQSCPALSDPMDCSLPGSSVHGIFQARVLEWGTIAFSGLTTQEELIPANNHVSDIGSYSFPSQAYTWFPSPYIWNAVLWEKKRTKLDCAEKPDSQNCCFKELSFGENCYAP